MRTKWYSPTMSLTFCLSAASSELNAIFFPPINLERQYEIALLAFEAFYSVYNIKKGTVRVGSKNIEVPAGTYEINELESFIQKEIIGENSKITISPNRLIHKVEITCTSDLHLPQNMAEKLGFKNTYFPANQKFTSVNTVDILPLSIINISVNLAQGIYLNGTQGHSVHTFFPSVPAGYHINETIANPIYYPVTTTEIDSITVKVTDNQGELLDFNSETITVVLHMRPK